MERDQAVHTTTKPVLRYEPGQMYAIRRLMAGMTEKRHTVPIDILYEINILRTRSKRGGRRKSRQIPVINPSVRPLPSHQKRLSLDGNRFLIPIARQSMHNINPSPPIGSATMIPGL